MNLLEIARKRFSVRNYSPKPIEPELLEKVLEAAIIAPSAVNFQPWKMIVVTDENVLTQLQETYPRDWFKSAPACIVALGDHDRGWHRPADGKDHTDIDVAIAIDHLTLAATEAGLGTCWVCHFNTEKIADIFQLPENWEPIALIPIGYPAVEAVPNKKRKSSEELISWNKF